MNPNMRKGLFLPLAQQLTTEGQLDSAVLLRLAAGCSMHLGKALEKVLAAP